MEQTSLLLGAGFSVNHGYPTANQLNEKLTNLHPEDFWIYTDGTVRLKNKEDEDPCQYSSYARGKYFIVKLIEFYQEYSEKVFNYEEFYDFYNEIYRHEKQLHEFDEFCDRFRHAFQTDMDNHNLLSATNNIFNQLIGHYLVDKEGIQFYEPVHYGKPIFKGYSGFLNCLENWGKNSVVHIHTLNHDIFFEIFKSSDWIQENLSDGFRELGSPYYGNVEGKNKVRLSYFTDEYPDKYRLYKLHGSVDQFRFHSMDKGIETYVKIKHGIGANDLYKEIEADGELTYINDWINYHPDFLSGTTSKILRYREPCYYEKIFNHFENNLASSESLVLIGYGFGDMEINNLISEMFDYKNRSLFVVEPFPSAKTYEFLEKFNGKLIEKTPDNLRLDDF